MKPRRSYHYHTHPLRPSPRTARQTVGGSSRTATSVDQARAATAFEFSVDRRGRARCHLRSAATAYVIVVYRNLTRWVIAAAVPAATTEAIIRFLIEHVITVHGCRQTAAPLTRYTSSNFVSQPIGRDGYATLGSPATYAPPPYHLAKRTGSSNASIATMKQTLRSDHSWTRDGSCVGSAITHRLVGVPLRNARNCLASDPLSVFSSARVFPPQPFSASPLDRRCLEIDEPKRRAKLSAVALVCRRLAE